LLEAINSNFKDDIKNAYSIIDKMDRQSALSGIKDKLLEQYSEDENTSSTEALSYFKKVEKDIVRSQILSDKKRIDGRNLDEVRNISSEVSWLPRTHGSALFTRGETQAIVVTTLGFGVDEQRIEALQGSYKEHFMLHYNFPPYSVGEVGRIGATGRREIGHGKLAWRALKAVLPSKEDFDYTIRLVSDITESTLVGLPHATETTGESQDLPVEVLLELLSRDDLHRLQQYGRNLVEYNLILDIVPTLATLYFSRRFASVRLSHMQAAILLALGCQHRTIDDVAAEFELPASQLLALSTKL
jgi:hypothetical protein